MRWNFEEWMYILNRQFQVNVLDPVSKPQGPRQLVDVGVRDGSDDVDSRHFGP